ncbi:hypothetical protein HYR53_00390 [Candidatus Acetothermia bacterium]|nr:hypothetical protein [Candidatus Acetothermia bacterium]
MRIKFILIVIALLVILLGLAYGFSSSSDSSQTAEQKYISVCSFNIYEIGLIQQLKDLDRLSKYIEDANCDLLLVQELKGTPDNKKLPSGNIVSSDIEAEDFVKSVQKAPSFIYHVSESDTGSDETHHDILANDWYIAFYNSNKLMLTESLPHGFLSSHIYGNSDFDRVPYAFSFKTTHGGSDFVMISVHLHEGDYKNVNNTRDHSDQEKRQIELNSIVNWIQSHKREEHDYFIVGDFNFQDLEEIQEDVPANFESLNSNGCFTNHAEVGKPFDDVLFEEQISATQIDTSYGLKIFDLVNFVESTDFQEKDCQTQPSEVPYKFNSRYSDHNLIKFRLIIPDKDDD